MDKSIVITGVSSGIGNQMAKSFAKKGYFVFGSVRKQKDAESLVAEFPDNYTPLIFDVTDYQAIDQSVAQVKEKLNGQPLTGLINNSGIALSGPLLQTSIEDFKRQFEVNLFGLIKVTQSFLPLLGASFDFTETPGRIINISSAAGQIGFPFLSPYCGSKHAVEGVSESLRRELSHLGIKVILVGPTAIKTSIWEKEGAELPDEIRDGLFGKQATNFIKLFSRSGRNGLLAHQFADKVVTIFEKRNPNVRYTISAHKFSDWIIPRYFPTRMIDKSIAKVLNWKKKK